MKAPELKGTIWEMATEEFAPNLSWVKTVTRIDETQKHGFMFVGEFLNDDAEIEIKPQLFLALKWVGPEWNKREGLYYVIRMDSNGGLHHTGVMTTGDRKGWAARISDDVRRLLVQVEREQKQVTPVPENAELVAAIHHLYERAERVRLVADIPGPDPFGGWTAEDAAAVNLVLEILRLKQ